MRRLVVPGIPFVFSLALSLSTAGSTVFWQDSGFTLTAVHEMSVLYPHGFVLYQLLCKAWTFAAAPLFGFTLAVHLFSALCAATAAAFLALAARAFVKRDGPAIAAACLSAAGFCFWHAAILAKAYALYAAALSALLWLMVRADKKRDFLWMGAVLGLAGAAHPSAALVIPAVLAYARARRDRIREWGGGFFAGVVALAVGVALAPSVLLPVLASRGSPADFGSPRSFGEVAAYALGLRFTTGEGAFGWSAARWALGARYVWEELLVGSSIFLVAGLARQPRGVLAIGAAWVVPTLAVPLLFRNEGQFDQWLVAGLLPLALAVAAGIERARARWGGIAHAAAGVAVASMVWINLPLLDQRRYDWAERFGRALVKNLDPGGVALFSTDDPMAVTLYLQHVRGERRDLHPINNAFLGQEWFERLSARVHGTRTPDYAAWGRRAPGLKWEVLAVTAFADANAGPGRPVFSDLRPVAELLRQGLAVVPAGMLWKVAPKEEAAVDERYWDYPVRAEEVPRGRHRARGFFDYEGGARAEAYEDRLFLPLLQARVRLADAVLEREPARALGLYESVFAVHPRAREDEPRLLYNSAMALHALQRHGEAIARLQEFLSRRPPPEMAIVGLFYLGEATAAAGDTAGARRYYEEVLRAGPPPALRQAAEQRLRGP